tara:strand:+ start:603 stop:971 length:369 start_codon:yes stop_codon:yes gene_type:complete
MRIYRDFTFEAAHVLDGYSKKHPYGRIHGHSFRSRVWINGAIDRENKMVVDLGKVALECESIKQLLDHQTLNDVEGLNFPTLEGLCIFIWNKLIIKFPTLEKIEVHRDQIGEGCTYEGSQSG